MQSGVTRAAGGQPILCVSVCACMPVHYGNHDDIIQAHHNGSKL